MLEDAIAAGQMREWAEQFAQIRNPPLEFAIVALATLYLLAQVANPIIEFLQRLWAALRWSAVSITSWLRSIFGPRAPPSHATPLVRTIPEEVTIWETRAPTQPIFPHSAGIPIICVANMKGGVGKTTIVANLAPHLKQKLGKPILLIDFDYQGSLSQTVRTEAGYLEPDLTSDILISPNYAGEDPIKFAREMRRGLEDIFIYPANYPLATIENNLLAQWAQSPADDLMYRLCALLKQPPMQEKYGAVLIDCPPRLTAGSINALCASTHLLVPTALDEMSAQAAEYFLGQVSRMRGTVFPTLKLIGVVPSITHNESALLSGEARTLDRLSKYGVSFWRRDDFVLTECRIPRKADISNLAGSGVPYLRKASVRQIFDRLGEEIWKRL